MHRTQISLDMPLYEELRQLAFERRVSMAHVVREALAAYLGAPLDPVASAAEAAGPESPVGDAGRGKASTRESAGIGS